MSLPGSLLWPTLFTIWAADPIEELHTYPRTQVFTYAGDKSLGAGATIELARSRAVVFPARGWHVIVVPEAVFFL